MPVRISVAALALVLGVLAGVLGVLVWSGGDAPGSGSTGPTAPPQERAALAVLHAWDVRRAAAWAAGDTRALAELYTRGSSAGAADVALLRRYVARGLVVRTLRMQVLRVRVETVRPHLLELEVTDRLASVVLAGATDVVAGKHLPADAATTHRLVLRRVGERWLMARVSVALPSGAAGRR